MKCTFKAFMSLKGRIRPQSLNFKAEGREVHVKRREALEVEKWICLQGKNKKKCTD